MKHVLSLFLVGLLTCFCYQQNTQAQCNNYQVQNITTLPDNCGLTNALNLAPYVNTCQTICIDNTTATPSSTAPSCGSGSVTNDIWGYVRDPYTSIPGFDGSMIFSWKKYPSYPNSPPTLAVHLDVDCDIKLGFITLFNSDLNCGFLNGSGANFLCIDSNSPNTDNTLVLSPNTIPTNSSLQSILDCQVKNQFGATASVQNLTSAAYYFQLETYNNVPGLLCFEVSTYQSGFSCGDPQVINFTNTGLTQSQSVTKCLCNAAGNSGYYTPTTAAPCTPPANGINVGTTAYYKVTAPYTCNQIGVNINSWPGAGSLNVTILQNVSCPIINDTIQLCPTSAPQYVSNPNWVVGSSVELASECLNATAGSNNVVTDLGTCLPAGEYYVLISANNDKDTFGATITVNNNTPTGIVVQAKAYLQGAFNTATGQMTTNLRTNNYLPLTQPFNRAPWNYAGTESVATPATIPANTTDWVLVEAHDPATGSLIDRRAAFLLNNGSIVDIDGIANGVRFANLTSGSSYRLIVRHRNHLDLAAANAVTVPNATPYDFSSISQILDGSTQAVLLSGALYGLRAGDTNGNGIINFSDLNVYIANFNTTSNYSDADCNLDSDVNAADFSISVANARIIGIQDIRL